MGITPDCEDWATMTFVRAEVGIPRKEWYCHCSTSTGRREGFGDRFCTKSHMLSAAVKLDEKARAGCALTIGGGSPVLPDVGLQGMSTVEASHRIANARMFPVRHRSHATYSRQPRQVRKEATVTGSCVCSEVPVPGLLFCLQQIPPRRREGLGRRRSQLLNVGRIPAQPVRMLGGRIEM